MEAFQPSYDVVSASLNSTSYLLTYAQSGRNNLTKKKLAEEFKKYSGIKAFRVAQEKHQSGDMHLHAVVQFEKKKTCRLSSYFNIGTAHPNIAAITHGTIDNCLDYIIKEDNEPLEWGEFDHQKGQGKLKMTAEEASKHSDVELGKLVHASQYERVLGAKRLYLAALSTEDNNLPVAKPGDIDVPLISGLNWINTVEKKRHLWIHGPSNTGKTTWVNKLKMLWKWVGVSWHAPFWQVTEGGDRASTLIVMDDSEIPTWTGLKAVLPGVMTATTLSVKGGIWKVPKDSWFIVLTNKEPYHGIQGIERAEITNRFYIVDTSVDTLV